MKQGLILRRGINYQQIFRSHVLNESQYCFQPVAFGRPAKPQDMRLQPMPHSDTGNQANRPWAFRTNPVKNVVFPAGFHEGRHQGAEFLGLQAAVIIAYLFAPIIQKIIEYAHGMSGPEIFPIFSRGVRNRYEAGSAFEGEISRCFPFTFLLQFGG